jgi:DNA excision repair protein ERCC-5
MKRRGEEEEERRKRDREREAQGLGAIQQDEDAITGDQELVYVSEMGMSAQERIANRKFRKTDAYHLPELTNGIEGMGKPDDPRIMSSEELEEYARQFNNGEDVNLYDFSKIDFNGEFFMSLPAGDRYNILNAARLRSRMRMGLTQEQLTDMFPDRMAFSRFQIERVRERNELTQRLMNLNGMNEDMFGVGKGRIAGERGREYVLVKNDGVEGGWALGVVNTENKNIGDRNKPIDLDAVVDMVKKNEDSDEDEDFEDVPVEGLNRLPRARNKELNMTYEDYQAKEMADQRRELYASRHGNAKRPVRARSVQPDTLFVDDEDGSPLTSNGNALDEEDEDLNRAIAMSLGQDVDGGSDEEDHLNRAIALSMQKHHGQESEAEDEVDFEDVPMPEFEQQAVAAPKPISSSSGGIIAHIVNNRANAAVPKQKPKPVFADSDSDSDMDLQSALAKARKQKAPEITRQEPAPVASNIKNPFDGPLPFERLDFGGSIFSKGKKSPEAENQIEDGEEADEDLAGGFDNALQDDTPKPLPPWLAGGNDIRDQVYQQKQRDQEVNAEDRERALEEERQYRKDHEPIEIESSDDEDDFEIVDAPPPKPKETEKLREVAEDVRAEPPISSIPDDRQPSVESGGVPDTESAKLDEEEVEWSESDYGDPTAKSVKKVDAEHPAGGRIEKSKSKSGSPEFEDVEIADTASKPTSATPARGESPLFEDANEPDQNPAFPSYSIPRPRPNPLQAENEFERQQAEDAEFDEFSDPDDEELLAQLAIEAEEHARFASTLNHKSEKENQDAYERELKALRNQQKKDRRDADEVSHIMITECQALLRLFGLPYITAPMEAEAQCAELVRLGLVDGVVTDDCDIFLFGGTRVYKNMFNSNKFVECYLSSDIEKELSLTRDQLISIAHLLGSDYTEGLPGVGPVTALEIISEFPTSSGLQDFKEWWDEVQLHPLANAKVVESTKFRKKFRKAQATKLFLPPAFPSEAVTEAYLKPEVDSTLEPFQWGVPDLDQLREFLMATIGWSQERTDEVLVPVIRDMNRRETEGTQSNITRFFEGAVGAGVRGPAVGEVGNAGSGSKRMKEAVGKLKARKSAKGPLEKTFGEEVQEWAKNNDLGWTEREQEKMRKGKGRKKGTSAGKRKAASEPTEEETEAEAVEPAGGYGVMDEEGDDESGDGDEYTETSSRSQGKAKSGAKSKGKGNGTAITKRKKTKV